MRKVFIALMVCTLCIAAFFSVILHRIYFGNHGVTFNVKESENVYQIYASYDRRRTEDVQNFMDAQLSTNHMFRNARMNADVTLDDKTCFYIRCSPGRLLIKMDKRRNDNVSYARMKALGAGIKARLAND